MNASPTRPPQLLVIDDNDSSRFIRAQVLKRAGFRVVEAATGEDGLAKAAADPPDLIVCDINLPDINGLEVSRRAKAMSGALAVQVLHVSQTETSDEAIARGLETGADGYLIEPVGPQVLVATVRSLLRLRAAEQQLISAIARETDARRLAEEANRAKDDFLAMLSHELRTPLNTSMAWLWQLRQEPLDATLRVRALDALDRATKLQSQIIRDLIDVSLIRQGKLEIELAPVDVTAVVTAVADELRRRAAVKGVELSLDAVPVTAMADASRLEQIVANLGNNAIQFTPRGGRVSISLALEGGQAVIRVRDTGEGIDPEFLPHVFERFRQADTGVQRRHSGLGLGLAIVRHLVEMHGGTATLESEGHGHGTLCTVRFPATQLPIGRAVDAADGPRSLTGFRLLVVEDDAETCELLASALRTAGAHTLTARLAAEAYDIATHHAFDLIISDIGLPGFDGIHLLDKLRKSGVDTPAMAVTAFATAADRTRVLASGFVACLAKPAAPAAVVTAAARLLTGIRPTV